jgi:hypothetical protein
MGLDITIFGFAIQSDDVANRFLPGNALIISNAVFLLTDSSFNVPPEYTRM